MPSLRTDSPDASPGAQPRAVRDELLRHLDAAYNLARWLCRNDHDAQDVVQESFLRAVRFADRCRADSARGWLLQIVRNTCHTWLVRNRPRGASPEALDVAPASESALPDLAAQRSQDAGAVRGAIEQLPEDLREVIVLREIEGLSYKEIAQIAQMPIGTVMSRLSRARERLKELLAGYHAEVYGEL